MERGSQLRGLGLGLFQFLAHCLALASRELQNLWELETDFALLQIHKMTLEDFEKQLANDRNEEKAASTIINMRESRSIATIANIITVPNIEIPTTILPAKRMDIDLSAEDTHRTSMKKKITIVTSIEEDEAAEIMAKMNKFQKAMRLRVQRS